MSTDKPSELLPPGFPPELADAAFISGGEAAWPTMLASAAAEWLGGHGYAVLGTELWLLQNGLIQSLPIGRSGTREVHGNTVNRVGSEPWETFVARAATATCEYLRSFEPSEIIEHGNVYFHITWVDEVQWDSLGTLI